jgi:hypothetical protein
LQRHSNQQETILPREVHFHSRPQSV